MQQSNEERFSKIAIIGLGYVGIPVAQLFVQNGFHVIGIDIDNKKLESLKQGKSYLADIDDSVIQQLFKTGSFEVTDQFHKVNDANACILCLPTPLRDYQYPDLSYIQIALKSISPYVNKGQLIVLESSTYPGTTEEVIVPILEQNGKRVGVDYFIGYSPERIDPGNKQYLLEDIPKVVSGVTDRCLEEINKLYRQVFKKVVQVSSPKAAEMTKLLENAQRFINISFMNETVAICHEMGIDIWEVIEAASSKPFGFIPYYPGPGIGGHCIPVDPLYLSWKAQQYNMDTQFINLSKKINDYIPQYIVERIGNLLKAKGKDLKNSKILLIGMTYKKDVNDVRESPAVTIFKKLITEGANVCYHDPLLNELQVDNQLYFSQKLTTDQLNRSDCVVILTNHSSISYDSIIDHAPLIFDTKNEIKDSFTHVVRL
ncbi:UDP-N-acetyl-D-glucosamine dehydrogenase [Evansella vedderi]|uniref:UDP-N-acetyl-D-glucosamine dehydrogenase n=1 Tax=Evansella vedderi TaxID=38282 RepID=A0ABT9ZVT4_9BACI|nr:nucleotide sugar dehydrogenase [Evansella vedderi]MDQ0255348.1 UDP-N-acetyl-D-glucosamine dehydrogenase [Evansella vedderi]